MKSISELEKLIVDFIIDEIGGIARDELSLESNLFGEAILDSISIMRLIAHIESSLQKKIPAKDLVPRNFMTIQSMITYLSESSSE